jgi:four helix bundle protein
MSQYGYKQLRVYQLAYALSLEIYKLTKKFPDEEKFGLTKQIRNSSRSVCSNIGEGYRKRAYPKHFVSKMRDSDSEASETQIWLDYAKDLGFITLEEYNNFYKQYESVGNMLGKMQESPEKFAPRNTGTSIIK